MIRRKKKRLLIRKISSRMKEGALCLNGFASRFKARFDVTVGIKESYVESLKLTLGARKARDWVAFRTTCLAVRR